MGGGGIVRRRKNRPIMFGEDDEAMSLTRASGLFRLQEE